MDILRILRHLLYPDWLVRQAFPLPAMRRIESAIADSEARHAGEIRFAVEATLNLYPLLRGQTARERAIEVFSALQVWDTEDNNGVLVYLLLADRDVEIVADRGIARQVSAEEWEAICREMEVRFRNRKFEAGVRYGIGEIGRRLQALYPLRGENPNELPDRPLRL